MSRWIRGRLTRIPKSVRRAFATSLALLGTFITAIASAAAVHGYVRNQFERVLILIATYVVVVTVVILVQHTLRAIAHDDIALKKTLLSVAGDSLNRYVSDAIEHLYTPVESIRALVRALHGTLATMHAEAERPWQSPRFQIAFMTMMDDGEIGILTWANNENRRPPSLSYREINPRIYKATATAELYSSADPRMRIVEDSSDDTENFEELYEGEFSQLRSSVIYPVCSQTNELLGTLVAHCNVPHFFRRSDKEFWDHLLGIYALRIALEMVRLDGAPPAGDV